MALYLFSCRPGTEGESAIQKRHYVADNAFLLTDEQESKLVEQIKGLEKEIGSQIAILTIDSLNGENIDSFSLRTADELRLGR